MDSELVRLRKSIKKFVKRYNATVEFLETQREEILESQVKHYMNIDY
jgi:flagellar capping protein FliD